MTNNLLTLLCLVEGKSNPIPVEIDPAKSIGQLKKAIKTEKAVSFGDVDADMLTLWQVEIPLAPLPDRKPIVLNEVDAANELKDPTDDVSDAFKEQPPKKTISVIIQRPGNAA